MTMMERMEALEKRFVSVAANIVVELTGLEKHIDRTAIDVKKLSGRLDVLEGYPDQWAAALHARIDEHSRRNPMRPRWDGKGTCPECGRGDEWQEGPPTEPGLYWLASENDSCPAAARVVEIHGLMEAWEQGGTSRRNLSVYTHHMRIETPEAP